MLLISIVFHGLLLAFQVPSQPEPKPESEPSPVNREPVKITSLVGSKLLPKSVPKVSKPQPKLPPKRVPLSSRQSEPLPPIKPQEEEKEEPQQQENQTEEKPQEETNFDEPQPEDKKTDESQSDDKKTEEQEEDKSQAGVEAGAGLLGELRARIKAKLVEAGKDTEENIENTLDSKPEEVGSDFLVGSDQLKEGAVGSLTTRGNPNSVYDEYIEPVLRQELGFQVEELTDLYGGASLYKAQNEQGIEFYMSLVKVGFGGSQTFVVIWGNDPRSIP
ncbi:MAG TPA: hypothetical protein DEG47_10035 [Cyanobacteria bacterium UBA11148]|nr:hypothetical protein [Cyanobacteria bacterium UBA11148]